MPYLEMRALAGVPKSWRRRNQSRLAAIAQVSLQRLKVLPHAVGSAVLSLPQCSPNRLEVRSWMPARWLGVCTDLQTTSSPRCTRAPRSLTVLLLSSGLHRRRSCALRLALQNLDLYH